MSESKELAVLERAAVALGAAEHEQALLALTTKYADITKIVNPAGREQCHAAYMELKTTRVSIEKAGKDAREDANAFQKAVIAEVDRLTAITAAEEGRLQALRDVYDAEREAERLAKAAADKARVTAIRAKIDEIKDCVVVGMGRSSGELESAISELETTEITLDEYGEFAGEAQAAQAATVVNLKDMLTAQLAHEAEQARIAAEREALDRQRAELAEQERQAAAARAEQEAKDRAERERIAEEQRVIQVRAATVMREQQEAHEARMAAERAEIKRQQDEIAAAKAEQERVAREAREAAEAETARIAQAETDRIFAEQERIAAERKAAVAEQIRREQEQFAANGPGDVEIVKLLAHQYDVTVGDVMGWMKKFDYAATDELLAAENVKRAA